MARTTPIEVLITLPFAASLIEQIQEVSPLIHINIKPAESPNDISSAEWLKTEVLYTESVLPDISQVPGLHWIQFHWAGVEIIARSTLVKKPDLLITTLSGAAVSQMAEYVIMMMLALGHQLPEILHYQNRAEWKSDTSIKLTPISELRGSVVGLIGYGSIAREIARLLLPFGVTILACKRDAMNPRDTGYIPEGLGDPEGNYFHRLYPVQAIKSMISGCDYVINTLPLTKSTNGLIGEDVLRSMKPGAYLIDVGRGGVIDETALITVLKENILGGAALDVFTVEPLPAENLLWKIPNVIISPHVSGNSKKYDERAVVLFIENLKRYLSGVPLLNKYDIQKEY